MYTVVELLLHGLPVPVPAGEGSGLDLSANGGAERGRDGVSYLPVAIANVANKHMRVGEALRPRQLSD